MLAAPGCSPYALAAARALIDQPDLDALTIGGLQVFTCLGNLDITAINSRCWQVMPEL